MKDDLELFERWANGEHQAGQALCLRHYDAVYLFFATRLAAHDAASLTQETFETMCMKVDCLHVHSSFVSYLFAIARRRLIELHRHQHDTDFEPSSDSFHVPGTEPTLTICTEQQHEEAWFVRALRRLPLDDQILLELRVHAGLQLRELAEILEVPLDHVSARLVTARERLTRVVESSALPQDPLTTLFAYMEALRTEHVRRF